MAVYIGVDFHARSQVISYLTTRDGEIRHCKLDPRKDNLREFFTQFEDEVIVGFEVSGYTDWFEQLLEELGHQVWVGDAAEIRRQARRRQKNDWRDADLILELMVDNRFPRVHRQSSESREILRQVRYRHRLVKLRTVAKNSLQAISLRAGLSLRWRLHSRQGREQLNQLSFSSEIVTQVKELNELIDDLGKKIKRVESWLREAASKDPQAMLLQTHPGIGLLTSLGLVHTLAPVSRFSTGRKVTAYLGMDPVEDSSGERVRIGSISKQGSRLVRFLVVEAGHIAVRYDEDLKKFYRRLVLRHGNNARARATAKVAVGRKLLIRSFIMLRDGIDYDEFVRRGVEVRSSRLAHRPNA